MMQVNSAQEGEGDHTTQNATAKGLGEAFLKAGCIPPYLRIGLEI